MRINFRQGIVTHAESTGGQAFLQVPVAGTVNIIGDVSVTFAHRDANYLHTEVNTVSPAWSGVPTSGDAWLYWDIDVRNAIVTYGYTDVQPVSQATQPGTLSTGLHWFDTVNNIMKEYDGTRFLERIRVFAARINGTSLFPMGSNTAKPYAGTQVGINRTVYAGTILFSNGLPVIVNTSNSFSPPAFGRAYVFATTETEFVTGSSQKVNTIRLESDFTTAAAAQNLAAYDVVKYNSAGRLEPAGYNDTVSTTIGMITDSASINSLATVILQGVIRNEDWNWTTIGAELFILSGGDLTEDDPNLTTPSLYPVSKPPVARVLNSKEIIFMQGLGKVGPRGLNPADIGTIGNVEINQNTLEINQALVFSGSPQLWRNRQIVAGTFGSPLLDEDFLQFDNSASVNDWVNKTRREAGVGRFGIPVIERNTSQAFVVTDADKGVVATTVGSPTASYTWTLNPDTFKQGDTITIMRRLNAANVTLEVGSNVQIVSTANGTSYTGGSPHFTLGNPAKAELWLVETIGSPYYGSPSYMGSPQVFVGSPGVDVWYISGDGINP